MAWHKCCTIYENNLPTKTESLLERILMVFFFFLTFAEFESYSRPNNGPGSVCEETGDGESDWIVAGDSPR